MSIPNPSENQSSGLLRRLDHAALRMNAVLVVIALGLAFLDLTCFSALTIEKAVATGQLGWQQATAAPSSTARAAKPRAP